MSRRRRHQHLTAAVSERERFLEILRWTLEHMMRIKCVSLFVCLPTCTPSGTICNSFSGFTLNYRSAHTAQSHTTLKTVYTARMRRLHHFANSVIHSLMICIDIAYWPLDTRILFAMRIGVCMCVWVCPNESQNSQSNGLITYNLTIVLRRIRFQCPIISILHLKKQIQIERCCAAGTTAHWHIRESRACVCACARWQNYGDLHRLDRRRQTASRHPSADILTNCVFARASHMLNLTIVNDIFELQSVRCSSYCRCCRCRRPRHSTQRVA